MPAPPPPPSYLPSVSISSSDPNSSAASYSSDLHNRNMPVEHSYTNGATASTNNAPFYSTFFPSAMSSSHLSNTFAPSSASQLQSVNPLSHQQVTTHSIDSVTTPFTTHSSSSLQPPSSSSFLHSAAPLNSFASNSLHSSSTPSTSSSVAHPPATLTSSSASVHTPMSIRTKRTRPPDILSPHHWNGNSSTTTSATTAAASPSFHRDASPEGVPPLKRVFNAEQISLTPFTSAAPSTSFSNLPDPIDTARSDDMMLAPTRSPEMSPISEPESPASMSLSPASPQLSGMKETASTTSTPTVGDDDKVDGEIDTDQWNIGRLRLEVNDQFAPLLDRISHSQAKSAAGFDASTAETILRELRNIEAKKRSNNRLRAVWDKAQLFIDNKGHDYSSRSFDNLHPSASSAQTLVPYHPPRRFDNMVSHHSRGTPFIGNRVVEVDDATVADPHTAAPIITVLEEDEKSPKSANRRSPAISSPSNGATASSSFSFSPPSSAAFAAPASSSSFALSSSSNHVPTSSAHRAAQSKRRRSIDENFMPPGDDSTSAADAIPIGQRIEEVADDAHFQKKQRLQMNGHARSSQQQQHQQDEDMNVSSPATSPLKTPLHSSPPSSQASSINFASSHNQWPSQLQQQMQAATSAASSSIYPHSTCASQQGSPFGERRSYEQVQVNPNHTTHQW